MYSRIIERLRSTQVTFTPINLENQNSETVTTKHDQSPIETKADVHINTSYADIETNYDGNSFITQFGGGLIAASYNIRTNEKQVCDFSFIPDQHRESIHCTQESVKRVISDEYGKGVSVTIQGQNNYQATAGQIVTPTVIEPFQQWPLSHDILNENTGGNATYAQRKYLDGLNHVRIGSEFTKAGQYSGTLLHGLGNAQSLYASLGSQLIHGSMTKKQREEVECAFFASQKSSQHKKGQMEIVEKEIREERKYSYLSERSIM